MHSKNDVRYFEIERFDSRIVGNAFLANKPLTLFGFVNNALLIFFGLVVLAELNNDIVLKLKFGQVV